MSGGTGQDLGRGEKWQDDDPKPVTKLSVKVNNVGMLGGGGTFDFELL